MWVGPTFLTREDTTGFERGGILRDRGDTPTRTGGETDVGGRTPTGKTWIGPPQPSSTPVWGIQVGRKNPQRVAALLGLQLKAEDTDGMTAVMRMRRVSMRQTRRR